ncbi:MAG: Mg chelatase, subunit ChlI [Solirubrobacterales bacterium]|nr:Mg chelatase, subunit ChlI [Solirubrobacterales bacterium]
MAISRARYSAVYPARFILLAATNPCPCGYAGDGDRCVCSEADMARHRRRLSGPLLDRIDLLVNLHRSPGGELDGPASLTSAEGLEQVTLARGRQAERLRQHGISINAQMDVRVLSQHVRLDEKGSKMMRAARESGLLSARGEHRVLRVARTIADLDGSERVRARDLGAAIALRASPVMPASRAA